MFLSLTLLSLLCWSINADDSFDFNPFFDSDDTSFFDSDDETLGRSFGSFSGFNFNPLPSRRLAPFGVNPSFPGIHSLPSSNIPVYSDAGLPGGITRPLLALNQYEKNLKANLLSAQRQSFAASNAPLVRKRFPTFGSRVVNDRRPTSFGAGSNKDSLVAKASSYSPSLQTGFTPIIKGSSQDLRAQQQTSDSSVLQFVRSPSLASVNNNTATVTSQLQASASSISSKAYPRPPLGKVFPERLSGVRQPNSTNSATINKKKFTSGSQFLNPSLSVSSSVSSRVVIAPGSQKLPQVDSLKTSSSSVQETKVAAKKAFDINCDGSKDLGWCELGDKYPRSLVQQVMVSCKDLVNRMHVEVPHSFERLSDSSDFRSELDNSSFREAKERGNHESWSWASYFHKGSLCEAERGFLRPEAAKDSTGAWHIVIQSEDVRQRLPIEMCRKTNSSCKKMPDCGLKSQCLQKYNFHLLLSLDQNQLDGCPTMKLYRFPSACVCHVE